MLIDWFTVLAQIINFLILVVLIRVFLYDRIRKVVEQRQELVGEAFARAESREEEAEVAAGTLRQQIASFEGDRQRRIDTMEHELAATRGQQLDDLRAEVQQLRYDWQRAVTSEKHHLLDEASHVIGVAAGELARRALASLADVDLEDRIIGVFLDRLAAIGADTRRVVTASATAAGRLEILTMFEPPPDRRNAVESAIARHFGYTGPITWARDSGLGAGIEIRAGGRSLGWNVRQYLDDVLYSFETLLDEHSVAGASKADRA